MPAKIGWKVKRNVWKASAICSSSNKCNLQRTLKPLLWDPKDWYFHPHHQVQEDQSSMWYMSLVPCHSMQNEYKNYSFIGIVTRLQVWRVFYSAVLLSHKKTPNYCTINVLLYRWLLTADIQWGLASKKQIYKKLKQFFLLRSLVQ